MVDTDYDGDGEWTEDAVLRISGSETDLYLEPGQSFVIAAGPEAIEVTALSPPEASDDEEPQTAYRKTPSLPADGTETRKFFDTFLRAYPEWLTAHQIAERTEGYRRKSAVHAFFKTLVDRGFVETRPGGKYKEYRATEYARERVDGEEL